MINYEDIQDIIKQEIDWHSENKGTSGNSADWEEGFIKGMEQIAVVTKMMNSVETI